MQVTSEQFSALEKDFRKRRRERLLTAVRSLLGHMPNAISDADALRRINEAIEDGKMINITTDEDLIRFAALAFLPDSVLRDPVITSSLVRTLNRDEWESSKRLDFIYAHVVNKLIPLSP